MYADLWTQVRSIVVMRKVKTPREMTLTKNNNFTLNEVLDTSHNTECKRIRS